MENRDVQERQLISRIHRLEGQVRALEKSIPLSDPLLGLAQYEAAIAAAKACLLQYVELALEQADENLQKKLLARLLKR